jgi:hypothetical protein
MTRKIYLLLFFVFMPIVTLSMNTTFFKPTSALPKVQPTDPHYVHFNFEYSHGRADQSFDENSGKAPLLAWDGTEELLNRFVYSERNYDDPTTVGAAYLDADYATINEFALHMSKNFKNGMFIASSFFMRDVTVHNIGLTVIKDSETGETYPKFIHFPPDEMKDNADLYSWCTIFPFVSGSQGNNDNIRKFNLSNAFFKVGYTKKIDKLHALDFFHFTILGGLMTPELNDNYTSDIIHLSLGDKSNFGLFAEGSLLVSKNKFLNFGATGSFIMFLKQISEVPLSVSDTNNIFLESNVGLTEVSRTPFTYFNVYYQAERLLNHLSILLGFSYSKQGELVYKPLDEQKYPAAPINKYSINREGWESGSIHFELEYDFNNQEKTNKPILSFSYTRPLVGTKTFISKIIAGSCSLNFSYKF